MPRFIFGLQALLDQRVQAERARRLAVAEVERERVALETEISALQRRIRAHKDDLRTFLSGRGVEPGAAGVDTGAVRLQAGASLHAQLAAQRQALRLAGVYRRLESVRSDLRRATTDRRAVELLKERRYEEWKREQARRETAALDELATMAAARRPAARAFDSDSGE